MINVHTLTLHETNRRGYVPVCSCGWMGLVQNTPKGQREEKGPVVWRREVSTEAATRAHAEHVERCRRPSVDRMNP